MSSRDKLSFREKVLQRERRSLWKEVELVRWMTWVLTPIAAFVVVSWLRSDSTIYAPGYSWSKFSSIRNGMTPEDVTRILGQPLSIEPFDGEIHWDYGLQGVPDQVASVGGPISSSPSVEANFVADWSGKIIRVHHAGASPETDEMVGKSLDDVRKRYGAPTTAYTIPRQTLYWYSKLRNVKGEYVMAIHFSEENKVYQIDADRIGHYCSTPGELPRPSSLLEWLEWYVL
jgi:outer membrane protein assembly factor BamE (lipoprotein component of BamABCDE complex)